MRWHKNRAGIGINVVRVISLWPLQDRKIVMLPSEPPDPHCDQPWLSGRVPNGFWNARENRVAYLEWLGERLGYVRTPDWYQVVNVHFNQNHGGSLLNRICRASVLVAMQDFRPQYEWIPWLFSKTPAKFWHQSENRRSYMKWLELRLGIQDEQDWYQVSQQSFVENHGATLLLNRYRGSILTAVHEYRPDYDWKPWLFSRVPRGFWSVPENRRSYFSWLAVRFEFKTPSDWLSLERRDLRETGGWGLLSDHFSGSRRKLLDEVATMEV
jgi:hypothetical protein